MTIGTCFPDIRFRSFSVSETYPCFTFQSPSIPTARYSKPPHHSEHILSIFRRAFRKHSEHISGCSKHVPQNSVHISLTFKTYSEKIRSTFPDAQSPFRKKFGASSPNAPLCSSAFEPHTFEAHPNAVQTKLPRTWCPERDSNPHDLTIRGF